jgi:hypothetical protein
MKEQSSDKTCKEFSELISAWFDNQLTENQSAEVEQHIKICPLCSEQVAHYQAIRNYLSTHKEKCPRDLPSTVMSTLERDQLLSDLDLSTRHPTPRWIKFTRIIAAAAMIAIVATAGFYVFRSNETTSMEKHIVFQQKLKTNVDRSLNDYEKPSKIKRSRGLSEDLAKKSSDRTELDKKEINLGLAIAKESIIQNQPTPAGPPMTSAPSAEIFVTAKHQRFLDQLAALTCTVAVYDIPTRMLVREQILELLTRNNFSAIKEHYEVYSAINNKKDFYYLAQKGLDLSPANDRCVILIQSTPEKLGRLLQQIEQLSYEKISRNYHPELKGLMTKAEIKGLTPPVMKTQSDLTAYFKAPSILSGTTQPSASKPATTSSKPSVEVIQAMIFIDLQKFPQTTQSTTTNLYESQR